MYHGKCSQFTLTIMVGTRDERDLRKEVTMNLKSVPMTSDDFIFVHLGVVWGKVECSYL